jgi:hypothetical protein
MSTFLRAYRLAFSNIYLLHHARLTGAELGLHFHRLKYESHSSSLESVPLLLKDFNDRARMAPVIAPALSAADSVRSLRILVFF